MPEVGGCDTGSAKITKGYRLPARYVIHAIGPIYSGTEEDEEVNVYIANLLHSLVEGTFYTQNAEVLADAPYDVFSQVEASESDRHKGFYRKNTTPQECYLEQAQQYYGWAACFPNDCRAAGDWRARCTSCARDFET